VGDWESTDFVGPGLLAAADWEGMEHDAQQWMRIGSTEQGEHGRLADTHGIRARWEGESEEQMDGRGKMEPLSHRFQVLPICPSFLAL